MSAPKDKDQKRGLTVAEAGRIGGSRRTPAQRTAVLRNLEAAAAKLARLTPEERSELGKRGHAARAAKAAAASDPVQAAGAAPAEEDGE